LLLVGVAISYLASRIQQQTEIAKNRERQTATLYTLSRNLTSVGGLQDTINAVIDGMRETFGTDAVIYLPDPNRKGNLLANAGGKEVPLNENELAAAVWSFEHQKTVGCGTDTLPNAKARFVQLTTKRKAVGVIALQIEDPKTQLTMERIRLLEAFADLAAVAIERAQLVAEARNAQVLEASEKLQTALLNSISHDLRTPLVSIIGALSSLQEQSTNLNNADRDNLIKNAIEEGNRLNHLVTNFLDVSRIEAKAIRLNRQPSDLEDIISVAREQLGGRHGEHPIDINLPADTPYLLVDFSLMVQVFINLLDNAFKYSPLNSSVEISGQKLDQEIEIDVSDRGVGIPPQDLGRVFDKFYRVERPNYVTGTGLGLSICKGIVEAHGGRIWAENRPGGGTIIRLVLPLAPEQGQERTNESK
jgi:two-component system sensor histidine kinase KdpD